MIRATASYTSSADDGDQVIEIEVCAEADYSPDLADDLVARARKGLAATVAEMWPAEQVET